MQVVVYAKQYKNKDLPYIQALFDALYAEGINPYIYTPFLNAIRGNVTFAGHYAAFDDHLDFRVHKIDFVITLGGDGTMLNAVTFIRDAGVPMLGINLGRMGFLADIERTVFQQHKLAGSDIEAAINPVPQKANRLAQLCFEHTHHRCQGVFRTEYALFRSPQMRSHHNPCTLHRPVAA